MKNNSINQETQVAASLAESDFPSQFTKKALPDNAVPATQKFLCADGTKPSHGWADNGGQQGAPRYFAILCTGGGGKIEIPYVGYGGSIKLDPNRGTTVIGRFSERPEFDHCVNYGTRTFLGASGVISQIPQLNGKLWDRGEKQAEGNKGGMVSEKLECN